MLGMQSSKPQVQVKQHFLVMICGRLLETIVQTGTLYAPSTLVQGLARMSNSTIDEQMYIVM